MTLTRRQATEEMDVDHPAGEDGKDGKDEDHGRHPSGKKFRMTVYEDDFMTASCTAEQQLLSAREREKVRSLSFLQHAGRLCHTS